LNGKFSEKIFQKQKIFSNQKKQTDLQKNYLEILTSAKLFEIVEKQDINQE